MNLLACFLRTFPLAVVCASLPARGADYQWDFTADLSATLGAGSLEYADATSQSATTFGMTDGGAVPHIGGQAANYMRVPAFTALAQGYNATFGATAQNGGGSFVNQYTFVCDVLSPSTINWTPFFNTNPDNSDDNDGDFYINPNGSIGIGALGYSAMGLILPDTWYRIAFTADLGSGNVSFFINGNAVMNRTGSTLIDGRFALSSNTDAGPDLRLFNEGDTTGDYTHELLVNSLAFSDRALSPAEIAALGGPNALGILPVPEPGTWALLGAGALAFGLRRRFFRPGKS